MTITHGDVAQVTPTLVENLRYHREVGEYPCDHCLAVALEVAHVVGDDD